MPRYRQGKWNVVDAKQFLGDIEAITFVNRDKKCTIAVCDDGIKIKNPIGEFEIANKGDWVICYIAGGLSVVPNAKFKAEYILEPESQWGQRTATKEKAPLPSKPPPQPPPTVKEYYDDD